MSRKASSKASRSKSRNHPAINKQKTKEKPMAKKSNGAESKTPRFTIEAAKPGKSSVGKLAIPRVEIGELGDTIDKLLTIAKEGGVEPSHVRGTLTMY